MGKRSVAVDMTNGNPMRLLLMFALPLMLSSLFQQFYNIVDMLVVGNNIGSSALAAISTSMPVANLFLAAAMGISVGSAVVISQYFGARQISNVKTTINTVLSFAVMAGIVLMIAGVVLSRSVLRLVNCPEEILNDAATYLRIYFLGTVFLFLYNGLNSSYNALGNSMTPLYFLIFSSLLNVALDLVFVIAFRWGVAGAAAATAIAQAVAATLSFFNMRRMLTRLKAPAENPEDPASGGSEDEKVKIFDSRVLKTTMRIALPNAAQSVLVSFSIVIIQSAINMFGPAVMAGISAAARVDSLATMPLMTLGNSFGTYAGQNIGAGRIDRIKSGMRSAILMIVSVGAVLFIVLQLFAAKLIGVFVDHQDPGFAEMVAVGSQYVRVIACFAVIFGVFMLLVAMLRGTGDMWAFLSAIMANFVIRVVMALFLSPIYGPKMIWWGTVIGWIVGTIIAGTRYFSGKWKDKAVVRAQQSQNSEGSGDEADA
ncbi:MAG: MATE family efflux transporter [Oscillospiraceae bacterium]|nr:MATE family efflux transporter [Oscillospiraceae bacterium]